MHNSEFQKNRRKKTTALIDRTMLREESKKVQAIQIFREELQKKGTKQKQDVDQLAEDLVEAAERIKQECMTREKTNNDKKPNINDFFTERTKQAIKEREQAHKEGDEERLEEAVKKVKKYRKKDRIDMMDQKIADGSWENTVTIRKKPLSNPAANRLKHQQNQ